MRFAMLSWEFLHSIRVGGVRAVIPKMAVAMEPKGHEGYIFTRKEKGQSHYQQIDGRINPAEVKAVDGIGPVDLTTLFVGKCLTRRDAIC